MSGFELVPLDSSEVVEGGWELAPIEPDRPSVLRNVALNNPATAIGEVAMNLGSQMVALPVAGLAGLATEAGSVVGLTDKTGADVVHSVGDALTYQPRGELGQTCCAGRCLSVRETARGRDMGRGENPASDWQPRRGNGRAYRRRRCVADGSISRRACRPCRVARSRIAQGDDCARTAQLAP